MDMNTADNTNNDKDTKKVKVSDEKVKYSPKKYPRAWEIGKKLAEDRDYSTLFNQGKKIK